MTVTVTLDSAAFMGHGASPFLAVPRFIDRGTVYADNIATYCDGRSTTCVIITVVVCRVAVSFIVVSCGIDHGTKWDGWNIGEAQGCGTAYDVGLATVW